MLNRSDLENILDFYNLGNLKSYLTYPRESKHLQLCYCLSTTTGKYFLKQYKEFDNFKHHGLFLVNYLLENNYPSVKLFNSKNNNPYTEYNGSKVALFEFLDFTIVSNMTKNKAYQIGKYLGLLHKQTEFYPFFETFETYEYYYDLFLKYYSESKRLSCQLLKVIEYIKDNIENLKVPDYLPQSICHVEFTLEHIIFKHEKVFKIVDWDCVNRYYSFYDLGTTLVSSFDEEILNFNYLAEIIKGYNKQRELTTWEKEHIFEAIQFGIFKFFLWGLSEATKQNNNLTWGYNWVEEFMKYDKIKFYGELYKFIEF
ncbi:phosphotransferase [Phormidium sp. LEGE 05292]|nr:phosphotransferase [Phormidium sp. LEGE 05292]